MSNIHTAVADAERKEAIIQADMAKRLRAAALVAEAEEKEGRIAILDYSEDFRMMVMDYILKKIKILTT